MPLGFNPPILNSASLWATTKEELSALYNSPSTGAVSVRTSLILGWKHDPAVHQHTFFNAHTFEVTPHGVSAEAHNAADSSLNTLGYSPISLEEHLKTIQAIVGESPRPKKPFIVSVTGSSGEIAECYRIIVRCASETSIPLLMEVNLSCPNIANKPPPSYSSEALQEYLSIIEEAYKEAARDSTHPVPIGLKVPPYTYSNQFETLIQSLLATTASLGGTCPISFITATNTLGSSLVLSDEPLPADTVSGGASNYKYKAAPALTSASGTGMGGLGGAAIHALALGNVQTLRTMLDKHESLKEIDIVGVGGVADGSGAKRMLSVGATAVGIATALGMYGIGVFDKVLQGLT